MIILSVVQGITEWLPVSSSGHLVIFQQLFNMQADTFFDIILHMGTLTAVVFFLRHRILKLIVAFFKGDFSTPDGKMILYLIISSIPIAVIGYLFSGYIEKFFTSILVVGFGLILTAIILFFTQFLGGDYKVNLFHSVVIGIFQAVAIIPGVSRSGMTISSAMLTGVEKKEAAEFSFLLSIPAILGAFLFKAFQASFIFSELAVFGFFISAIVGFITLGWLMKIINSDKLHYFAPYCLVLGIILILIRIF